MKNKQQTVQLQEGTHKNIYKMVQESNNQGRIVQEDVQQSLFKIKISQKGVQDGKIFCLKDEARYVNLEQGKNWGGEGKRLHKVSKRKIINHIWKQEQQKILLNNVLLYGNDEKIDWFKISESLGKKRVIFIKKQYDTLIHQIRNQMEIPSHIKDRQAITLYLYNKNKTSTKKSINKNQIKQSVNVRGKFYQKQKKVIDSQQSSIQKSMQKLQKLIDFYSIDPKPTSNHKLQKLLIETIHLHEKNVDQMNKLNTNFQQQIQYIDSSKSNYVDEEGVYKIK